MDYTPEHINLLKSVLISSKLKDMQKKSNKKDMESDVRKAIRVMTENLSLAK